MIETHGEPLPDISFKIKAADGENKGKYIIAYDDEGQQNYVTGGITLTNIGYDDSINDGTRFTTDKNGNINIKDILVGKYTIEEIYNPYYGYKEYETEGIRDVKVEKKQQAEENVPNTKYTGNLEIDKIDADSLSPLEGIGFRIKSLDGDEEGNNKNKYIIVYDKDGNKISNVTGTVNIGSLGYAYSESGATEFYTDSKGIVRINNILEGNYEVKEFSVGDNYGYEIDDEYIEWFYSNGVSTGKGHTAKIGISRMDSTTDALHYKCKNRRKYIKLSGYVWEDLPSGKTQDGSDRDNIYKPDSDKLLKGIPVTLKKSHNNIVASTVTGENGQYSFEHVLIDDISDLYVEFQYNGMGYENVDVSIDKTSKNPENGNVVNGSKASEGVSRDNFNKKYDTIIYGQSITSSGTYGEELKYNYNSDLGESKLKYGDNSALFNYGYEGNGSSIPFTGVYDQYYINANTKKAYGGNLDVIRTPEEIRKNDIEEFKNINLGLKKREEVDLSVDKDIQSVKVHINGQDHVYKYENRFNSNLVYNKDGNNGFNMSPAVKFGQERPDGTLGYTRALYASDFNYGGTDQLSVSVTYIIGIQNASSLTARINEITDYYDIKYDYGLNSISAGTDINDDGTIKEGTELNCSVPIKSKYSGYAETKITLSNFDIEKYSIKYFYVQLTIDRGKIKEILETGNEEVKSGNIFDNIFEITSYSIKDSNGASYAAIDKNSQPGNTNVNNTKTYENDTGKAPGLKLVLQEERKVSGTVFVDQVVGENKNGIMQGQVRQGDGKYTNEDAVLKDVTVKLIDSSGKLTKVYDSASKEWKDAEVKTSSDGSYTIGGFIPGEYKIQYTWGDKEHKVQDYKATIVDEESYNAKGNANGQNIEWYKNEFKQNTKGIEWDNKTNTEIRRSDAIDDYTKREKIDEQTKLMTNANKKVIENYEGEIELEDGNKEQLITQMESTTPVFKANLEYYNSPSTVKDEYETNSDGTIKTNGIYAVKKAGKENYLRSIDFGIVERAKQALQLNKKIERAKITLSDMSTLVDAKIENGKLVGNVNNTVLLPKSNGSEEQLKIEIDNEIIEGARLEIEYGLEVENISELDYLNENFYKYGSGHGQNDNDLVTLNAQNVIDYLDNNISANEIENIQGTILQSNEKKNELITKGLLADTLKGVLNDTNKVLLIKEGPGGLSSDLKPTSEANKSQISLVVSKLLANVTNEDHTFGNEAEIIKISKSGGSTIITTTGNYIPGNSETSEYDNDKAEDVTIINPTGEDLNYTPIVLLSISILGIISTGIILIKKYVLKGKK